MFSEEQKTELVRIHDKGDMKELYTYIDFTVLQDPEFVRKVDALATLHTVSDLLDGRWYVVKYNKWSFRTLY